MYKTSGPSVLCFSNDRLPLVPIIRPVALVSGILLMSNDSSVGFHACDSQLFVICGLCLTLLYCLDCFMHSCSHLLGKS